MKITLTQDLRNRTEADLISTEKMLSKELAYATDLQNNTKKEFLTSHISFLKDVLVQGFLNC